MLNHIRPAVIADAPAMVSLSSQHRLLLQQYQPIFWRKAEDDVVVQLPYFETLIADDALIKLVADVDQRIEGFVIAARIPVPSVYRPNGDTYLIDDFCVSHDDQWLTIGAALLEQALAEVRARGATQIVVVCPHLYQEKRTLLQREGLTIASEWYVNQI